MKAFKLKRGRIIDFEGSRKNGIQQASFIDIQDYKITNHSEYLATDGIFSDWVVSSTSLYQIDYWVAHNANVEINLIKEHTPYKLLSSSSINSLSWGPWIDTLYIYRKLYPDLQNLSLQNLSNEFLNESEICSLASQLCIRTGKRFHQSMFDCLITYLLLIRLSGSVDLALFLS